MQQLFICKKPAELRINAFRALLRGEALVPAEDLLRIERSLPHGHVEAIGEAIRRLGLDTLTARNTSRHLQKEPTEATFDCKLQKEPTGATFNQAPAARNTSRHLQKEPTGAAFDQVTEPTPVQARAPELLAHSQWPEK